MASFLNKLRMDNIFPVLPFDKRREDEEEFSFRIKPSEFDPSRIQSNTPILGQSNRINPQMNQGMNPELSKPMDVVYNPPESDKIGIRILGYDNAINPFQRATLADKDADRELKARQLEQTNTVNQQKITNAQRQLAINETKAKYAGSRVIAQKGGNIRLVGPDGKIISDFGPTGEMSDAERLGLEQSNQLERIDRSGINARELESERQLGRESLADMGQKGREGLTETQARHAKELEAIKQSGRPTGSTTVENVTDSTGKIVGSRNITNKDTFSEMKLNLDQMPAGDETVSIIDPKGIRRKIPRSQLEEAIKRGAKQVQ